MGKQYFQAIFPMFFEEENFKHCFAFPFPALFLEHSKLVKMTRKNSAKTVLIRLKWSWREEVVDKIARLKTLEILFQIRMLVWLGRTWRESKI